MSKFLVEVGANDGVIASKSRDLILSGNWRGLFIEPIKFYFDKLSETYAGNKNVELLNVAISNKEGQTKMYRINPKYLVDGFYGHGVNSFNRDHSGIIRLENHFGKGSVIEETVTCYPLSKIFKDRNIQEIDLLIIDTEGHDYYVISCIDFNFVKPKKIIYENIHLRNNDECENYLQSLGYNVQREGMDTYCTS